MRLRPFQGIIVLVTFACGAMISHSLAGQAGASSPDTPILIDVNASGGTIHIAIDGRVYSEQQLGEFLRSVRTQFGDGDPVYLRIAGDVTITTTLELRDFVRTTHPKIHLVIMDRGIYKELELSRTTPLSSPPLPPPPPLFLFDNPPNPVLHKTYQPFLP